LAHGHNSYAHFCVARRRHQQPVANNEANHRSTEPPAPSHNSHFFKSPEPEMTCSFLWPEGPSVTAKHVPKHFVDNVVWHSPEHDPYSARVCDQSHSLHRKYVDANRYVTSEGFIHEPRIADLTVFDGTSTKSIAEVARSYPPEHRIRMAPCATPRPEGEGGMKVRRSRSSDGCYRFDHTPGRPPHPDTWADAKNQGAHVYRSQKHLVYDKHLCHTDMRHSERWTRMMQGSPGHSAGGSSFSSLAGGQGDPHERRPHRPHPSEPERRARSADPTSKSRSQPKSARAASSERLGRSRSGQSSRRRGA
jgi:hypothetical protein